MEGRKQWQQVEKKPKGRGPLQWEVARCWIRVESGASFSAVSQPQFSKTFSAVRSPDFRSTRPGLQSSQIFCTLSAQVFAIFRQLAAHFFGAFALCSLSRFSVEIEPHFSCLKRQVLFHDFLSSGAIDFRRFSDEEFHLSEVRRAVEKFDGVSGRRFSSWV